MNKKNIMYVITDHKSHKKDMNQNGVINGHDDIVEEYKYDKKTKRYKKTGKWRLLNSNVEAQLESEVNGSIAMSNSGVPQGRQQRVVYDRVPTKMAPPANGEPPPVVVKNDTGFGHYVKAGAGLHLGGMAVEGVVGILGGLFD